MARKTDYDYECVLRAIYNDFITEMQFREEGYSGKSNAKELVQFTTYSIRLCRRDPFIFIPRSVHESSIGIRNGISAPEPAFD